MKEKFWQWLHQRLGFELCHYCHKRSWTVFGYHERCVNQAIDDYYNDLRRRLKSEK